MLSSVLNSKKAIQIMRIFNYFRKMLSDNANIIMELEKLKKVLEIKTRISRSFLNILMI